MRRVIVVGILFVFPALADIASVGYVTERDKNVVHKIGDESIGGTKTFESTPMIPTAKLPTLEK